MGVEGCDVLVLAEMAISFRGTTDLACGSAFVASVHAAYLRWAGICGHCTRLVRHLQTLTALQLTTKEIRRAKRKVIVTGYVLHETNDFVVIATLKSINGKTGNMVQVWIFYRHESPMDAVKNGNDAVVCFDCIHRGKDGAGRTCYVNLAKAPRGIWRAYRAGKYPTLPESRYAEIFGDRRVRFGAYGEPVLIPLETMRAIAAASQGWTGYTHQWRKPEYQAYREFVMASCDSVADRNAAEDLGWRKFRARTAEQSILPNEIICPASDEGGHRTKCIKCLLCNGARTKRCSRKDVVIIVHGSGAKNFVAIGDIAPAA